LGGCWIAAATSLPPIASGIDSPTGAVLVLLSASAGADVLAAGGTPHSAVQTVLLLFTAAKVLSGALLYSLGKVNWGAYFRFVPYFVVGGFLTATGWFLIAGGVRMTSGHVLSLTGMTAPWTPLPGIRLAAAVVVIAVLLTVGRWVKWPFAIPFSLIAMWVVGALVLRRTGLSGTVHGFYLPSLGTLTRWSPLHAARESKMTWSMITALVPELLAVTIVALISMVTKVSSIEVGRQTSGDLDREFRAHGLASLIAAPFGGIASGLQVGTSRLLEHAGGATRMSGMFCAVTLGAVAHLCEMLAAAGLDCDGGEAGFAPWLQRELGSTTDVPQLLTYFERKDLAASQVLYRQGEPANTIDLVAAGNLAIDVSKADGTSWRVRRIMTYRVVGEMGFFRRSPRAATVSSDGSATLFTLSRENFERMRIECPVLAASFDDFILRVLADRVEFANDAIAALARNLA